MDRKKLRECHDVPTLEWKMGEVRLQGSLQRLNNGTGISLRTSETPRKLTVNGSLRRSICANALKGTNVRLKIPVETKMTNWEFVRKSGSASSEDNRSREASSHVR